MYSTFIAWMIILKLSVHSWNKNKWLYGRCIISHFCNFTEWQYPAQYYQHKLLKWIRLTRVFCNTEQRGTQISHCERTWSDTISKAYFCTNHVLYLQVSKKFQYTFSKHKNWRNKSDLLKYFWIRKLMNPSIPATVHIFSSSHGAARLNAMYKCENI